MAFSDSVREQIADLEARQKRLTERVRILEEQRMLLTQYLKLQDASIVPTRLPATNEPKAEPDVLATLLRTVATHVTNAATETAKAASHADVFYSILLESGRGMSAGEVWRIASERGATTTSSDPANYVDATLRRLEKIGRVARESPGRFIALKTSETQVRTPSLA